LSTEHDVAMAGGCDAALEILGRDPRCDVILCDLMMPLGDGMTFYERLGQLRPELQWQVIFMTGGAFTDKAMDFLGSVSNKMIEKPFSPSALRRLLSEMQC
jgi:CheY-like chemotaxis protein